MLKSGSIDVAALAIHRAKIVNITETKVVYKDSHRFIVTLELEGLNQVLGLNDLSEENKILILNNVRNGDVASVLFLKDAPRTTEGINTHVWEMKANGHLYVSIAETRNRQYLYASLMLAAGVLMAFLLYRRIRKDSSERSNRFDY